MNILPTIADVERITAVRDPLVRNLQITQCYHELSQAIVERTGPQANWCTFAVWASRQAGQTIRKEDLRRTLEEWLFAGGQVERELKQAAGDQASASTRSPFELRQAIKDALGLPLVIERTSAAVAQGNQKVFAEIGREFARFCATCLPDSAPDPQHIAAFCSGLRPGEPPDGQGWLRQAFTNLYAAMFEDDPKLRAERLFCANLQIGFHEQTRLQPEIQAALDAPLAGSGRFLGRVAGSLFPGGRATLAWLALLRWLGRPSALDLAARQVYADASVKVRQALTEWLMTLELADGVRLRLARDLHGDYPPDLYSLSLAELLALLAQLGIPAQGMTGRAPASPVEPPDSGAAEMRADSAGLVNSAAAAGSGTDLGGLANSGAAAGTRADPAGLVNSGAVDWANLPERLHFIAALFRLQHANVRLFEAPFTPEQSAAIKAGRRPPGRL